MVVFAFFPFLKGVLTRFVAGFATGALAGGWVTKAVALGVSGGFVTLLIFAFDGLLDGIAYSTPVPAISQGIQLLPNNTSACMGAIFSALTARWVYSVRYSLAKIGGG